MIGNLDLLYSCFNQYLFQTAKENLQSIRYYYQTNPATSGNTLVEGLLDAIRDYDLENLGEPLFQSILLKSGKNQAEYNQIMGDIMKYKMFTKDQIEPAKKLIKNIHAGILLSKAGSKFKDDPCEYINYIKGLNFKSSDDSIEMVSTKFGSLDLNSMLASGELNSIPSRFEFINNSFPSGGYPSRGLIMFSAPPGTGKSLWAMQEALSIAISGKKVHYMALADLTELDFIVRLGAIYYGIPFSQAQQNIVEVYKGLKKVIGDNLEITCVPANTITVDEYVDFMKDSDFEVGVVDYDSNFKSGLGVGGDANMYLTYGDIYEKLSFLTVDKKKLIFVLAQPQKSSWRLEAKDTIELDQIGESSRKQHAADMIITGTRESANNLGLSMFKIVKNRRGEEQVEQPMIRLASGRFYPIPKGIYSQLCQIEEKRNFSEAELAVMVQQYNQTRNNLNEKIAAASQQQQQRPVKNPF